MKLRSDSMIWKGPSWLMSGKSIILSWKRPRTWIHHLREYKLRREILMIITRVSYRDSLVAAEFH